MVHQLPLPLSLPVHQISRVNGLRLTSILHALLLTTGHLSPHHPTLCNAAVSAFARRGSASLALGTLSLMHRLYLPLDSYALCASAASAAAAADTPLHLGTQIHAYASKSGWCSSIFVAGALVNLYSKTSQLKDALKLFDQIPAKNSVCFNSLLSGFVDSGLFLEALSLIRRLKLLRLNPDGFTLSSALRISGETAHIESGSQAHAQLIRRISWIERDGFLLSSLVEMYGRCGLVGKARIVFDSADERSRDVVLWTSMLNAYGRNGNFQDVIASYEEMLLQGTEPDELVLLAVLSACRHSGCVVSGMKYFASMKQEHRMVPGAEHYGCVVDMLCKAGEMEKAWGFANEMVLKRGGGDGGCVSVWGALLSACRNHGNVEMGNLAAEKALELDPGNAGIYVELSNLYASVGMWDEIGKLRELIKVMGLKKDVGCSWLDQAK